MLDTLKLARRMQNAGMPPAQAETLAEVLAEVLIEAKAREPDLTATQDRARADTRFWRLFALAAGILYVGMWIHVLTSIP